MLAALLLAAGESTRMGSPKCLLGWHGQPLIRYQVGELRRGGGDLVVVVLGHHAERVRPFIDDDEVAVVYNSYYREGRASSVRAGAQAIPPNVSWIAVLGVDQPRPAKVLAQLAKAAQQSTAAIIIPVFQGRHGHPTLFDGRLLPEMAQVQEETLGLREVVRRHEAEIEEIEADSEVVLVDLNTPEDYKLALAAHW